MAHDPCCVTTAASSSQCFHHRKVNPPTCPAPGPRAPPAVVGDVVLKHTHAFSVMRPLQVPCSNGQAAERQRGPNRPQAGSLCYLVLHVEVWQPRQVSQSSDLGWNPSLSRATATWAGRFSLLCNPAPGSTGSGSAWHGAVHTVTLTLAPLPAFPVALSWQGQSLVPVYRRDREVWDCSGCTQ